MELEVILEEACLKQYFIGCFTSFCMRDGAESILSYVQSATNLSFPSRRRVNKLTTL